VVSDVLGPALEFRLIWQFPVQQEISNFEIVALFCKLIDWITAIFEDALVAINERNSALARGGVHEGGIVGHQAKIVVADLNLTKVHRPDRTVFDLNLVLLTRAIVCDAERVSAHRSLPSSLIGLFMVM